MSSRSTILVFAAGNSTRSINKRLAKHAAQVLQDDLPAPVAINVLDLNDYEMAIYSPEREQIAIPRQAQDFYAAIGAADGLIISLPEYNGSYTVAFKNILDWSSRIKMQVFQGKPTLLMATSIGARGGQNVLATAQQGFPHFGANVTSSFCFGPFKDHFDTETNRLKTPELALKLRQALVAFNAALPS